MSPDKSARDFSSPAVRPIRWERRLTSAPGPATSAPMILQLISGSIPVRQILVRLSWKNGTVVMPPHRFGAFALVVRAWQPSALLEWNLIMEVDKARSKL